ETIAAVSWDELEEFSPGLICLTGGAEGLVHSALVQNGQRGVSSGFQEARNRVDRLAVIFGHGNVYFELQRHFDRSEEASNQAALAIAESLHLPIVATNGVQYATRAERELLDVFTAIRHHATLEDAGRLLAGNSERHIKYGVEMQNLFADLPHAIAATR